jgi:hypothetical protein
MNEFRRAKRRQLGYNVPVVDTMTEETVGRLGNLSETGMLLIISKRLHNDALYQLRFALSDPDGREHQLEIGAHELWEDEAGAPGQIWAGLRFIDVSQRDVMFIREWVEQPGAQYV